MAKNVLGKGLDALMAEAEKEAVNNRLKELEEISKELEASALETKKELDLLVQKIYDYIMEQIYNKIFPPEPDPLDNMIYLNCKKAGWIEPKHLLKENDDFILSNFISDVSYYV